MSIALRLTINSTSLTMTIFQIFPFYIGDAEIISIDTFNKFHHGNNVVVGITFIKVNK